MTNTANKNIFLSMSCPQTSLHKGLNYSCSPLSLNSHMYQLELHSLRELKTSIIVYLVSFICFPYYFFYTCRNEKDWFPLLLEFLQK